MLKVNELFGACQSLIVQSTYVKEGQKQIRAFQYEHFLSNNKVKQGNTRTSKPNASLVRVVITK